MRKQEMRADEGGGERARGTPSRSPAICLGSTSRDKSLSRSRSLVCLVSIGCCTPSMKTTSALLANLQRVAGPDDDVGAPAGRKAAEVSPKPQRFGRTRCNHRQRLAPADTARARHILKATRFPAYCRSLNR